MNFEQVNLGMIKLPLSLAPREVKRVNFTGSFVSILTNNLTIDPLVSADSGNSSSIPAGIGLPTVRLSPDKTTLIPAVFRYLEFENPSQTETMEITFSIALGTPLDTRAVVQGYLQIDLSAPALSTPEALTVVAPADPEAIQPEEYSILPANAQIKERIVQNTGANPIWWGDENTDPSTGRGLRLLADGDATINCHGAVYFIAEGGPSRLSVVNVLKVA